MSKTNLTIKGDRFYINDALTYNEIANCPEKAKGTLMNARFIQGLFNDTAVEGRYNRFGAEFDPEKNTDDLIAALPQWYEKGLRGFTVGLQGGGPCFTVANNTIANSPYSADGKTLDEACKARLLRLLNAADELGMVVIVSLFYAAQVRFLDDNDAVRSAVKTMCNILKDTGLNNIIVEISNEYDISSFKNLGKFESNLLTAEEGIVSLMDLARKECPYPIGCSAMGGRFPEIIFQNSDVILIHGNGQSPQQYFTMIKKGRAISPARPIVCNEDSHAISRVALSAKEGVSWGYYNNMTKQEPPTNWTITKGEDEYFATRMALSLGIDVELPQEQVMLQGLTPNERLGDKAWVRIAALYPEKIEHVDFYQNGKLIDTAYEEPFHVNYENTWRFFEVENVNVGDNFTANVLFKDGTEKEFVEIVK